MKIYRKQYTVTLMSKTLQVSSSGYYKWLANRSKSNKRLENLDKQVLTVFKASKGTYGGPRIAMELQSKGISCSKSSVGRRMKLHNLCARAKKRYVVTTDSSHDYQPAPNLLMRNFEVEKINTVWVSDITYVRVANYWMYLTVMLDLADRMIVGWSLSASMTAESTVNQAFKNSIRNRGVQQVQSLMIHSDRGVQYASTSFRALLKSYNCVQSMSRRGNCWDNAVAESFFKTIKVEELSRYRYANGHQLYASLFRYIDGWYNTRRIHTSLGGMTPMKASLIKQMAAA